MRRRHLLTTCLLAASSPAFGQEAQPHAGPVRALAVLRDGRVASGGSDKAVMIRDAALTRVFRAMYWHQGPVDSLVALADGSLASGGAEGLIGIWADPMGEWPTRELIGHGAAVLALAAAADGRLASASADGTLRLWQAGTGASEVLDGHRGPVTGVAFTSEGLLVSAGADGSIRLWQRGEPPQTIAELGLALTSLATVPGFGLATAGTDGQVRLLAPRATPRLLATGPRPIAALAVSGDGRLLAVATSGGGASLWYLPENRLLGQFDGPGLPAQALAFSADGRVLYSGGADRRVRRWDTATGKPYMEPTPEPAR